MAIKKEFFLNILLLFIPVAFVAGNLVLNLNILLVILFSLFYFRSKIFEQKLSIIDKLLVIFFLYILVNGIINGFLNYSGSYNIQFKSFTYLRFLLLYFVLKLCVKENIINFKYLFFSFGTICLLVVLDIIIQYLFGQSIFGYEVSKNQRHFSGPFGDEYIAGSFIQRFFIFALCSITVFLKIQKVTLQNIFLFSLVLFFLIGCILAGNRVPLVLFIMILFLFFLFEKHLRKKFVAIFIISSLIFSLLVFTNNNLTNHYKFFAKSGIEIKDYLIKRTVSDNYEIPNNYSKEIETGLLVWEDKKIFGGGVKSFYSNCVKVSSIALTKIGGANCNTHPHNYYLHILTELGLIGLLLCLLIFITIIIQSLKIIFSMNNSNKRKILLPLFLVFIAEIFPFKTTGSFFTSANSIFLFIIISFIVGLIELEKEYYYE